MVETIVKFFAFAGPRKKDLYKAIAWSFADAFFQGLQIVALYVVLKDVVSQSVTPATAWISFGLMLTGMAGTIAAKAASMIFQIQGSFAMCADHRIRMADRMRYMPMGYFNSNSLGRITATVTTTMEDIQDMASNVLCRIISGVVHGAVITLILTAMDLRIGMIALSGELIFLAANRQMQALFKKISPARMAAKTALVAAVLEYVQGMGVVRSVHQSAEARKTIDRSIADCQRQNAALELAFLPFFAVQTLVLKLTSLAMALAAVLFYLNSTMTLPLCLLIQVSSFIIFSQMESAGSVSALLRTIDLSLDQVQQIYQIPVMDETGCKITPDSMDIRAENLVFSYGGKRIIDDVGFEIPGGRTVAIVGPSGGGKTTLCNLIARFWDPDSGAVYLGGHDLTSYSLDSLMPHFSMVFQRVYLFNDTIGNNIGFGCPGAGPAAVRKAAEKACCHEFIKALPQGYDTLVGEGGATLSGGERQRISIARAILKDAPVIILDEATANVDPENESLLRAAIGELTRDKTVIMIAHKLKTVRHADRIWVLDKGRIIEQGPHDRLMAQGGLYAEFIGIREKSAGWKI